MTGRHFGISIIERPVYSNNPVKCFGTCKILHFLQNSLELKLFLCNRRSQFAVKNDKKFIHMKYLIA